MDNLFRVCSTKDVPLGDVRVVVVDHREIAVFNINHSYYAMDNLCPHRGAPLSDGRLEGHIVTCPWHGWQFDVTTGKLGLNPQTCQKTYPVEIRGGTLFLRLGENKK